MKIVKKTEINSEEFVIENLFLKRRKKSTRN